MSPTAPVDAAPRWAVPLLARVGRRQVRAYRRRALATFPVLRRSGWNIASSILAVTFAACVAIVVVGIALFALLLAVGAALGELEGISGPATALVMAAVAADLAITWFVCRALIAILRRDARFGTRWRRITRLARFAEANGLGYTPERRDFGSIGMIFDSGKHRRATDVVQGDEGLPFELGNYQYAGASHEGRLRRFGFIRIGLPRRLPHMMLVAHANRRSFGRTSLPWRLPGRQILTMGAPLDDHFTLYCPPIYADDARYVLTPRLIDLLTERARDFDVEIIDDRIQLYRATPLRMTDPITYELLGGLISTIGTRTADRADLYRDPRALRPGRIGPAGRRLQRRAPVLTLVTGALAAALLVARLVTAALGIGI